MKRATERRSDGAIKWLGLRALGLLVGALLALAPTGCSADAPLNPSFPLRHHDARDALLEMHQERKPLERPVVVLGGIHDPGFVVSSLAREVRDIATEDAQVIDISFFTAGDFDRCRQRVIEAVDDAFGETESQQTVEVDVVAMSMGGLVARYSARPDSNGGKRLNIKRLFTIATPHRGAQLAGLPTLDRRIVDMRSGSEFLETLNVHPEPSDPELIPYTRLGDVIVGAESTAPPGRDPWWVQNVPFSFAHLMASHDARILADIARRLRGETPYTTEPAAPLP